MCCRVCCSVLQCVAVSSAALAVPRASESLVCAAVCAAVCVAVCGAVCCSAWQSAALVAVCVAMCGAVCCSVWCSMLQCVAMSSAALPVLCACQRLEVAAHTIRMPASATLSTGALYSSQKSLIFLSKVPCILFKKPLIMMERQIVCILLWINESIRIYVCVYTYICIQNEACRSRDFLCL